MKTSRAEEIRKQKIFLQHQCELPELRKDVIVQFIDNGYFVNLRRKFRRFVICSEKNPRSKLFLKSSAAIYLEQLNHLQSYYYMIHPFSMMRVMWEVFMMIILCILLLYIPIDVCMASKSTPPPSRWLPKFVLDVICLVDIVMSFFTGYQESVTKQVIMKQSTVAFHYLRTWFFLDLISSLNADVIMLALSISHQGPWPKIPSLLKFVRIATLLKYMDRFREWRQYSFYSFKLAKLGIIILVLVLWNTSILFLLATILGEVWIPKSEVTDSDEKKLSMTIEGIRLSFLRIVMNFMLVAHGEKNSENLTIIVFEIGYLILGWILKLAVTAQIVQIVMKYSSLSDKYYQMIQQFTEYMKSKSLPQSVHKRVLDYFEFRFQRNYYKESEILSSLSNQLKQEIIVYSCSELFKNSNIFRTVPFAFLVRVSYYMKMEIYLPNDVIISAGNDATCMYFLLTGMVAVYDTLGKEVCHMADGAYFGEMSLFASAEKRNASVVSIDFCELYTLSKSDFTESIAPYPDLRNKIENLAKNHRKNYLITETDEFDEGMEHEYLSEPRSSKIRSYHNI